MDVSASEEHIHPAIIIKEERCIMIGWQTAVKSPPLGRIVCTEHHGHVWVIVGNEQGPEGSLVVTERCGPLPTSVHRTFLEVVSRCVSDFIKEIGDGFPMRQVTTPHDRPSRKQMHGGGNQIVIVTHANDVGVRSICPHQRILHLYALGLSHRGYKQGQD